ncbi:hypothetical protein QR98_0085680 [Sarcoptes scabiei]|uniref:Uncharacterized protein n=1 Tax=Sarcoptes scabiei TaxID=52283 RepID=A0A132AGA8_SARSC|nr:hypothetical protein QR98_0085680 [Sarcoptes scabiei]
MPIIVYHYTNKSGVVSTVLASSLLASLIDIITLIGNHFNNYYIIFLFFYISLPHCLANLIVSIWFPWFFFALIAQIITTVLSYFRIRFLRKSKRVQVEKIQEDNV